LSGISRIGLLYRTGWGRVRFEIDDVSATVFDGD
jgi:hypothetical protein